MRSSQGRRRWLSGWIIALLLFMQWVTATYACPQLAGTAPEGMGGAGADAVVAMASMPDCSGDMASMDPDQPQLCKAHCEAGQQSVNSAAWALDAPPSMAHGGAVVGLLDAAETATLAAAMPPSAWGAGPPAGAPPLYLTLQVLRN